MTLLEKIKQDMLKAIDRQNIVVEELDSYEYNSATHNAWCNEPSSEYWDEDEEWQAKLTCVIDKLKDGYLLGDFIDTTEEEDDDETLKLRIIAWLESLQEM